MCHGVLAGKGHRCWREAATGASASYRNGRVTLVFSHLEVPDAIDRPVLCSYAEQLIEKGTVCIKIAKQKWSVGAYYGVMITFGLALVFMWMQNQEWAT